MAKDQRKLGVDTEKAVEIARQALQGIYGSCPDQVAVATLATAILAKMK